MLILDIAAGILVAAAMRALYTLMVVTWARQPALRSIDAPEVKELCFMGGDDAIAAWCAAYREGASFEDFRDGWQRYHGGAPGRVGA